MITLKLGDYDVEINAHNGALKDHEKDTLYLLNQLCIICGLAAGASRDHGYEGIAAGYHELQMDLYKACVENGLYGKVAQYDIR